MEMMLRHKICVNIFRKQKAVNNVSLNIEKDRFMDCFTEWRWCKSTTLKNADRYDETNCRKDLLLMENFLIGKIYQNRALIENPPIYENLPPERI